MHLPMISRPALVALALLALTAADGLALDQPVSARKLILRHTASGQEKISFLIKDPAILFPPIGSADDPATGTPGGAVIELFSELQGQSTIVVPGAVGWFSRDGSPALYKFVNKLAPDGVSTVSSLLVKSGKAIRLRGASTGFGGTGQLGRIGVRITMGSLRTCALFDDTTIKRDEGRVYLARDAASEGLADCSNGSLGGPTCADGTGPACGGTCPAGSECGAPDLNTCECIAAAQPCGDTAPVCNGECPTGEVCGNVGGLPYSSCACLPGGVTNPCGDGIYPTCGGDCPSGLGCFGVTFGFGGLTLSGCECLLGPPPPDPCGGCPAGFECIYGPGIGPFCLAFCSGGQGAPVCDGACPAGTSCMNAGGVCACG
jgi:hypothetical protein